jgi:hypothetical protein
MSEIQGRQVGNYHFSSLSLETELPSDEVLEGLIKSKAGGKPETIHGLPNAIFEDESEKGRAFRGAYNDLCQEVSLKHPYIICFDLNNLEGLGDEEEEEEEEIEISSIVLMTAEFDAAIEPRAVELAKSFGLI